MAELPGGLSMFDLRGRVALVTGGGKGLGKAFAQALISCGADVAIAGRDSAALEAVCRELACEGRVPFRVAADVTDPEQVKRMVAAVVERFGRLDIVVHAAGVLAKLTPVAHIQPRDWQES